MESENVTFEVTVLIKSQDDLYISRTYGVVVFDNEPLKAGLTELSHLINPTIHFTNILQCITL